MLASIACKLLDTYLVQKMRQLSLSHYCLQIYHHPLWYFLFRTTHIRYTQLLSSLSYPSTQPSPYCFFLGWPHPCRQPTGCSSNKHARSLPRSTIASNLHDTHILPFILPAVLEVVFADLRPMPDPPYALPNALPNNTYTFGPVPAYLLLQHFHPIIHFLSAQLRRILCRPRYNIRMSQCIEIG